MDKCRFAVVGTILQTRLATRQLLFCSCYLNSKLEMHVKVQKQALTQIREMRTSAVLPLLPSNHSRSIRKSDSMKLSVPAYILLGWWIAFIDEDA